MILTFQNCYNFLAAVPFPPLDETSLECFYSICCCVYPFMGFLWFILLRLTELNYHSLSSGAKWLPDCPWKCFLFYFILLDIRGRTWGLFPWGKHNLFFLVCFLNFMAIFSSTCKVHFWLLGKEEEEEERGLLTWSSVGTFLDVFPPWWFSARCGEYKVEIIWLYVHYRRFKKMRSGRRGSL